MMTVIHETSPMARPGARRGRRFSHWTPRYVADRVAEILYRKTHPDHPWLTRHGVLALDSLLRPTDVGVEFGSGRSTVWIARRVKFLTSVEHNEAWFRQVSSMLESQGQGNVDYHFVQKNRADHEKNQRAYTRFIGEYDDEELDFVLVDGIYRDECARIAVRKLKRSGLLIIDNANWYLPCNSRSPDSRSLDDGPHPDGAWQQVHDTIKDWRLLWTSSGVTDTAIFFKP